MNRTETAALLLYVAARDNRKADDAQAEAWFEDLGDLSFEDCKAAVRHHFQKSHDYLMPSHVRDYVAVLRSARVDAAGDLTSRIPLEIQNMPDGPEQAEAERVWLREAARRISDGELVDDFAPRLQLVPSASPPTELHTAIEQMAREKRAPGTRARDEGETA